MMAHLDVPILKELEELDRLLNAARRTLMEGTTPTDRDVRVGSVSRPWPAHGLNWTSTRQGNGGMLETRKGGVMEKGSVEKVEELTVDLLDMLGRFSEKTRAVMAEVMGGGQGLSVEEIKQQVQLLQEEVYQETVQKYSDFVGATVEAERDLAAKMTRLRDLKERAGILKDLITSLVKPGRTELATSPPPPQECDRAVQPQG